MPAPTRKRPRARWRSPTFDRAKTAFFSNVSHEFRTPLALMIGPTEDALAAPDRSLHGEALQMVHRNELRLLKLVNSLLDFSRMEAGRVDASFRATDLAQLTADLASQFRAAIEKCGLRLVVEAEALPSPAFVDREMWEKIVLNLLSNAFKHTFEGEISVRLDTSGALIRLVVSDSGVGISEEELPRIFERFHRVRGARSRSHEGTGIGLALVRDLVKLHGGHIAARSRPGLGTSITVSIPSGSAHLPADRIEATRAISSTAVSSAAYVNDALSWLPPDAPERAALTVSSMDGQAAATSVRILLADDNADMREYLRRLLSANWSVEVVGDGLQALEAVRRRRPTLLVSDVMMPGLDGLELARALRADPATKGLPIILLSARTGAEALAEGLASGANDYVVKPFSARELLARVQVQLEIARSLESDRVHEGARMEEEQFRQVAESTGRARDEFLAVLGHELRNPLAPIVTALELMELRGEQGSIRERAIIARQVKHVTRLVDDLLEVSRVAGGEITLERRLTSIAAIVANAAQLARPLLEERKHHLVVSAGPPGLALEADPVRLAQVFSNLLSNAARFTDPGGAISISAALEEGSIAVRVKDNGNGIEPALLPRIFEAFAQGAQDSDRALGGLGLGLTIVKSLVALHGGQVEARSAGPGTGSEFIVRLPAASVADTAAPPPAPATALLDGGPRGLRVLVVDDNEDAAILLSEILRMRGHEVVVAHDGASALEARVSFLPEVALLDIGLPLMDGYQLAGHLRAEQAVPFLRLIAITGYGEEKDRLRSKAAGFDEHLVKPVDIERVCRLLSVSPTASA